MQQSTQQIINNIRLFNSYHHDISEYWNSIEYCEYEDNTIAFDTDDYYRSEEYTYYEPSKHYDNIIYIEVSDQLITSLKHDKGYFIQKVTSPFYNCDDKNNPLTYTIIYFSSKYFNLLRQCRKEIQQRQPQKYNIKKTIYANRTKLTYYDCAIISNIKRENKERTRYEDMSDEEKNESDKRRLNYYKKKKYAIADIIDLNPDLNSFITLTYAEAKTDYEECKKDFDNFKKRLIYFLKQNSDHPVDLKYVTAWEYQPKRSKDLGYDGISEGVVHFHMLCNTGFIDHKELQKIWNLGHVLIEKVDNRKRVGRYLVKYLLKSIDICPNTNRGKCPVLMSRNLNKPVVTKHNISSNTLDDLILMYSDDITRQSSYNIIGKDGKVINTAHIYELDNNVGDIKIDK